MSSLLFLSSVLAGRMPPIISFHSRLITPPPNYKTGPHFPPSLIIPLPIVMSNSAAAPAVPHTVCDCRTSDLLPGTHCECENEEPNLDLETATFREPINSLFDNYFSSLDPRPPNPFAESIEWQFITPSAPGAFSPSPDGALGSAGVADAASDTYPTNSVGTDTPVPSFRFSSPL